MHMQEKHLLFLLTDNFLIYIEILGEQNYHLENAFIVSAGT